MNNFNENIDKIMEELKLKGIETVELEDSDDDNSDDVLSNTTHMDKLLENIAKNKKSKNPENSKYNKNKINETVDDVCIRELLKVSMENKIANAMIEITKIVENDKSDKPLDVKEASACFTPLRVNPEELCPHDLRFFQCMPCSH